MMDQDVSMPNKRRRRACALCGPTDLLIKRIPKREPTRSKWIEFYERAFVPKAPKVPKTSKAPTASSTKSRSLKVDYIELCTSHFEEGDICRDKDGNATGIMPTAVPRMKNPKENDSLMLEHSTFDMATSMRNSLKRIMSKTLPGEEVTEMITSEGTARTSAADPDTDLIVCATSQGGKNVNDEELESPPNASGITLPSEEYTGEHSVTEMTFTEPPSTPTTSFSTPRRPHHHLRYIADIKTPDLETPRRRRECLRIVRHESKVMKRKLKTVATQNRRLKVTVKNLKGVLEKFKKENLLTEDKMDELLEILPVPLREMVLRKVNKRSSCYSAELRKFALTLHYYSPRAYTYARKVLCNVLPSPSTLRKWCCSSNFEPGFSTDVLESLKRQKQPVICNLVLDEMSIRQQVQYKHDKWYGFVNTGDDNPDHTNTPHATSAFVFLLVALNGNFKVPMGYFLISSMTGKERANLLRTALVLAEEHGVHIHSVTFDGHQVNFTMAKQLGACFEKKNYQPFIIHPTTLEKVYCFPDPTHMIKNARNAFGETATYNKDGELIWERPITDSEGGRISWKYIVELHDLQTKTGLHYGNHVTDKHVKYKENIQHASYAIQVLSNSVADALTTLEKSNKMFKECAATAKFCRMMNQAFDILNVRTLYDDSIRHMYRTRLEDATMDLLKEAATDVVKYIDGLTQWGGTPILQCTRKCAFVGFVACLQNIFPLYEDLQQKYGFKYLLTYKLLQDQLENLFSAIRSRGGYNNNPSAYQFEHAIRRIVVHHEITASENSNCKPDDIPILTVSSAISKPTTLVEEELLELDSIDGVVLTRDIDTIVTYIAGSVVRRTISAKNVKNCRGCRVLLVDETKTTANADLINAKNRGKLLYPTDAARHVCLTIEKFIRKNTRFTYHNQFEPTVTHLIVDKYVGMSDHLHCRRLLRNISKLYVKLRLNHESKFFLKIEKYVRRIHTKLTLFKGQ